MRQPQVPVCLCFGWTKTYAYIRNTRSLLYGYPSPMSINCQITHKSLPTLTSYASLEDKRTLWQPSRASKSKETFAFREFRWDFKSFYEDFCNTKVFMKNNLKALREGANPKFNFFKIKYCIQSKLNWNGFDCAAKNKHVIKRDKRTLILLRIPT